MVVSAMKWFRDPRAKEQDRLLFDRFESLLSEEEMEEFLATLKQERAFQSARRQRVLDYLQLLKNDGPGFRDRRLQEKAMDLAAALQELKAHTAGHFLAFPRNQEGADIRLFLHPDYFVLEITNVSIEQHRFYIRAEQDLFRMVDHAAAAFRDFRSVARKRLEL